MSEFFFFFTFASSKFVGKETKIEFHAGKNTQAWIILAQSRYTKQKWLTTYLNFFDDLRMLRKSPGVSFCLEETITDSGAIISDKLMSPKNW